MADKLRTQISTSSRKEFYLKHLYIINPVLPVKLTGREMEVLAEFMCEPEEHRFGTDARRKVIRSLGLSRAGMSNYLRELHRKGFIHKNKDTGRNIFFIDSRILPVEDIQGYEFYVVNNDR